jgi:hypothetical protein
VEDHEGTAAEAQWMPEPKPEPMAEQVSKPMPESTGVAAADSALERLRDVETAPLEDHVEIFDDVQQRLHDGLAELDDEQ